eukprot:NODE_28235_length_484_cov_3.148459.p2 GENE.NODE_28235_length_484_cov_3.148459~~NODE_28235_length_484_cov_3.148459.p2  ORF type:complete len:72 (-),score=1.49 NODE_28235_length_484_cov_3.148459:65-280(-)
MSRQAPVNNTDRAYLKFDRGDHAFPCNDWAEPGAAIKWFDRFLKGSDDACDYFKNPTCTNHRETAECLSNM